MIAPSGPARGWEDYRLQPDCFDWNGREREPGGFAQQGFAGTTNGGQSPLTTLVGGGLLIVDASPTVRGNVILGNVTVAAGGIYVSGGAPLIDANEMINNDTAGGSGGGIYCDNASSGQIRSNVIVNNIANAFGGGGPRCGGACSSPNPRIEDAPRMVAQRMVASTRGVAKILGGDYGRPKWRFSTSRTVVQRIPG